MKWRTYPEHKDSGSPLLGMLPYHWEVRRLKTVTRFAYGDSLAADARIPGDYNVFGSNGVVGQHNVANTLGPCVVIGRKGSFGRIAYSADPCFAIDTTYFIDALQTNNHLRWVFYLLQFLQLDAYSKDSAVPGLAREDAYENTVPYCRFPEQRAIAAFLDRETERIDALIAARQRQIELLQEKRAALISHVVTKGIPGATHFQSALHLEYKDSGIEWLGEIPAHWEVKRLKFIARIQSGVAKGRDLTGRTLIELPYLRVANVQSGYVDLSDVAIITIADSEVERYSLLTGDVLMTEGGDYDKLGRGTVWKGQIAPCVHQNHIFAVRPFQRVDSHWISIVTQAAYARHYFILRSKQTTNLASISSTNIVELPVVLPPPRERQAILAYLTNQTDELDTLIIRVQESIDKLHEYRTALISAAVTGKIDVGDHQVQRTCEVRCT